MNAWYSKIINLSSPRSSKFNAEKQKENSESNLSGKVLAK